MTKLCLVVTTVYSQAIKERDIAEWTREVAEDQVTIEETLTDYDIQTVAIDASVKSLTLPLRQLIEKTLNIDPTAPWEACHIVLNTHGAAGSSDLSNNVISEIVLQLSMSHIPVTQISALQCTGLSGLSAREVRALNRMMPEHQKAGAQEPSLERLRNRLQKLETSIQQSFHIYGFSKPYSPLENKEEVKALLQGKWDEYLEVKTQTEVPLTPNKIRAYMSTCLEAKKKGTKQQEYNQASDILGKVLHNMVTNITVHLRQGKSLNKEDGILYNAVFLSDKKTPDITAVSPEIFLAAYKTWIKENKITSDSRMFVLAAYCDALESKDAKKISGSVYGFFPIHRESESSPMGFTGTPQIDLDSETVATPIPDDDPAKKP